MLRLQRFQQPLSRIALSTKGLPLQSLAALPKNYNSSLSATTFTIQKASFSNHIPLIDRLLNNVPKGFEKYFRKNSETGAAGANKGKGAGNKGNPNGNKNNNMPPENDPVTLVRTLLALGALAFAAGLASQESKSGR